MKRHLMKLKLPVGHFVPVTELIKEKVSSMLKSLALSLTDDEIRGIHEQFFLIHVQIVEKGELSLVFIWSPTLFISVKHLHRYHSLS